MKWFQMVIICRFLKHYLPQFEQEPGWKSVICTKLAWGHVLSRIKFNCHKKYEIHAFVFFGKIAFKYNFRCDETATWCRSRITETPCVAKFLEKGFKVHPKPAKPNQPYDFAENLQILLVISPFNRLQTRPHNTQSYLHVYTKDLCGRWKTSMSDKWFWDGVLQW